MHPFGDWGVFVVLVGDAVDCSFVVAGSACPFAVSVGGGVALPFPAAAVGYLYEPLESG